MATISRLLQILGLFCRIQSLLRGSFAQETYNFQEPTNCSHLIRTFKHTQQFLYMHTNRQTAHAGILRERSAVYVLLFIYIYISIHICMIQCTHQEDYCNSYMYIIHVCIHTHIYVYNLCTYPHIYT